MVYNDEVSVFVEKNSLTYDNKTKIENVLIKTDPFPCSPGSSDKSCYNIVDYQFQCPKKQGMGTQVKIYKIKTNKLLSDIVINSREYENIRAGSLLEHTMNAVCTAKNK